MRFRSIVFSGGGCRCFWQAGFLEVVRPALAAPPEVVAGVSAGAAMACMVFAELTQVGVEAFKGAVARNPRNAYWRNLWGADPVFPHSRLYRQTMLSVLDASGLAALQAGPDVRVAIARTPARLGPGLSLLAAAAIDQTQRAFVRGLHVRLALRFGFRPEVHSVRDCATPEDVAELILHSSCTPPFTPYYRRAGQPTLDGGLIDPVPVDAVGPEGEPSLVLLSRPHDADEIPDVPGRRYVWPSVPTPVSKWDYTSAGRIQATVDLGRRDGEAFLRERDTRESACRDRAA